MEIFSLFQQLNDEGLTIVMVTHERDFATYAKRILQMRDGVLHKDTLIKKRRNAAEDLKMLIAKQQQEEEQ